MKHDPRQLTLALTHIVTTERGISLVCIPDRDSAECELTRLRHQYGPDLLKAAIRKDPGSRRGGQRGASPGTYTLRYFIREHRWVPISRKLATSWLPE